MTTTTYTPTSYLLDHTQITATAHKLYTFVDTQQWSRLSSSEVFTPHFTVDYTDMFGGEPSHDRVPRDVVEEHWRPMMGGMVSTQHMMASVVVEGLPAPGGKDLEVGEEVKEAKVTAYVIAHLTKRKVEGVGKGGELLATSNGGIAKYEVVKMGEQECRELVGEGWDGNRWRIRSVKVMPKWYEGDVEAVLGKVVPL